jgi:GrpB-like predicted nucleotidyltransferase (UPF0157 family)
LSTDGAQPRPDVGYRPPHVRVDPYNPRWPTQYEEEVAVLRGVLGTQLLAVEHVGSTSIRGMPSKPTIDILADIELTDPLHLLVERLEPVGYVHTPDDLDRQVFRKGPQDWTLPRTHHLHVCPEGSDYWRRIVAFRDYLRTHPDTAAEYLRLKRDLATRFSEEPGLYTSSKRDYVTGVVAMAGLDQT